MTLLAEWLSSVLIRWATLSVVVAFVALVALVALVAEWLGTTNGFPLKEAASDA